MTMSTDGATSSLNCIGFCNSKLFQERRRVFRPLGIPMMAPQSLPTELEKRQTVDPPSRKNIKVKRMRKRRDKKRKYTLLRRVFSARLIILPFILC